MSTRDELIALMESSVEGRCRSCHKPIATDEQWETVPGGGREDLCWNDPGCMEMPEESTFAVPADALIAEGWRKKPDQDSILRAMWESRVGKCNDAEWAEERRRLTVDIYAEADAILALMDRGQ